MSGLKVRTLTYLGKDGHFVLTCNLRAMFRILSVTRSLMCSHTLSYGDKGHQYDCACVKRGLSLGMRLYYMCTRVRAQTL